MAGATPVTAFITEDLSKTNPAFDAQATSGLFSDNPGLVAWAIAAGGYRIGYLASTGALGSPLTGYPSVVTETSVVTGPIAVACEFDGNPLAMWANGVTINQRWYASVDLSVILAGTVTTAPTTPLRLTCVVREVSSSIDQCFAIECDGGVADQNVVISGQCLAGTTSGLSTLNGHGLASRAWVDTAGATADAYVAVVHPVLFFPYVAAIRISAFAGAAAPAVARLLPRLSSGLPTRSHLPSVIASGRRYTMALGVSHPAVQFGRQPVRRGRHPARDARLRLRRSVAVGAARTQPLSVRRVPAALRLREVGRGRFSLRARHGERYGSPRSTRVPAR